MDVIEDAINDNRAPEHGMKVMIDTADIIKAAVTPREKVGTPIIMPIDRFFDHHHHSEHGHDNREGHAGYQGQGGSTYCCRSEAGSNRMDNLGSRSPDPRQARGRRSPSTSGRYQRQGRKDLTKSQEAMTPSKNL